MSVGLADQPCVVPALDRAPGELVAAVPVSDPVSGAPELFGVGALAELEPGRVDRVDVAERVPELVDLRPWTSSAWRLS